MYLTKLTPVEILTTSWWPILRYHTHNYLARKICTRLQFLQRLETVKLWTVNSTWAGNHMVPSGSPRIKNWYVGYSQGSIYSGLLILKSAVYLSTSWASLCDCWHSCYCPRQAPAELANLWQSNITIFLRNTFIIHVNPIFKIFSCIILHSHKVLCNHFTQWFVPMTQISLKYLCYIQNDHTIYNEGFLNDFFRDLLSSISAFAHFNLFYKI